MSDLSRRDSSQIQFRGTPPFNPCRHGFSGLYLMGLNLRTHQIAAELDRNKDDAHDKPAGCVGIVEKGALSGEVDVMSFTLIAGFKGRQQKAEVRKGATRSFKTVESRQDEDLAKKSLHFGMVQRGGEVVLQMLSNVKQATIAPIRKWFTRDADLHRMNTAPASRGD